MLKKVNIDVHLNVEKPTIDFIIIFIVLLFWVCAILHIIN